MGMALRTKTLLTGEKLSGGNINNWGCRLSESVSGTADMCNQN
jgi:hypothetical protein